MRRLALVMLISVACLQGGMALAQSPLFLRAYELALANDPAYRAAVKEYEASQFNRDIGNAAVRPVISFSQTNSTNRSSRTLQDNAGRLQHDDPQYLSGNSSLALRQPLISYEGIARQKIGESQAQYGQAVLANKRQDVVIRLLKAWTELHFAHDQVRLAKAQLDAYGEQLKLNEASLKLGEGTKTDLLETRTKYEITMGQLLEANLEVSNKQRALEAIIGVQEAPLEPSRSKMKLGGSERRSAGAKGLYWVDFNITSNPEAPSLLRIQTQVDIDKLEDGPLDEGHWVDLALSSSPELRALEMQVELGLLEVQKAQSGHMPKLDLTLSRSHARSETLNTLNQMVQTTSLGVQLTVPIYAGGQISASVSQAAAAAEQQRAELEKKTQEIRTEIRKQLNLVRLNRHKKQALMRAVDAAEDLVVASRKSAKAGVKVNLDILNAVQQVFTLKRDLALASYSLLNSWAGLRAAAGQINEETVRQMAQTMTH